MQVKLWKCWNAPKYTSNLRTHKVNGTRYLILFTTRIGDQIAMIDLADETKILRY
jgi:hypothetical protein